MTQVFDSIVIGSGVAGTSVAYGLHEAGEKVAIVEADLWGGTCPNRGCDPKKVLVGAVEAQESIRQLQSKGFGRIPAIHWSDLMTFKKTFTDPVPEKRLAGFQGAGIVTYTGEAAFIDEKTIQINEVQLSANRFILATGAQSAVLEIAGSEHFLTSDDFLSLPQMPKVVTFVGGGYIAFEFAAIANAAGAEVHIIHHNRRPLKEFDIELVADVMAQLSSKGVTFHLDTNLQKLEKNEEGYLMTGDSGEFTLSSSAVFCTTGRIPNIEKLNLAKAGVTANHQGIQINEYLQTSNPAIYACGDVIAKKQAKLTPVSVFEANYLVEYLTGKSTTAVSYPSIPTVVYASPKLAQVGVTVLEASQDEACYYTSTIDMTNWFTYQRVNEPLAKTKIIVEIESGLIVGATCLSSHSDDLINYFSLLIDQKISAEKVAGLILAYPTMTSDLTYLY